MIYLIGSLRNPDIPTIANKLRDAGHEVFDDWHAAGPNADDEWKRYETERGRDYIGALSGHAAQHVFEFDLEHLDSSECAVLVMPAGKSAHLEIGYMAGQGKRTYVLMDTPDRWDVMYQFTDGVFLSIEELVKELNGNDEQDSRCYRGDFDLIGADIRYQQSD